MSDKEKQITQLNETIAKCTKCIEKSEKSMYNIVADRSTCSPKKIGYWSDAFPNYDAELMIVGQDWGNLKYLADFFEKNGNNIPSPYWEHDNPTWENLMKFLDEAGFQPGGDGKENIYLTNAVLCLRSWDKMTGSIPAGWFINCSEFLKEQIKIVNPKIIAALGSMVFAVLARLLVLPLRHKTYKEIVLNYDPEDYKSDEGIYLFPLYHTGGLGLRNRKVAKLAGEPIEDFRRLKDLLDKCSRN